MRLKGVEATTLVKEGIDVADEITEIIKKEKTLYRCDGWQEIKIKGPFKNKDFEKCCLEIVG